MFISAKCGGTIRDRKGEVHAPLYSINKMYPTNIECEWKLIGPIDHYLQLHFNKLDTYVTLKKPCNVSDHITITETNKVYPDRKQELGTFCGQTKPDDITTSSNEVTVNFKTYPTARKLSDFSLSFNATQDGTYFIR